MTDFYNSQSSSYDYNNYRDLSKMCIRDSYELFTKTIGQAAKNVHKRLRQVEYRTQAPDHPILWAADESYYLKFYIFQVCNDR